MEIYKCLHDIITLIENKEPLLKARGVFGNLILIDTNSLKYNERLEGANIFKMLLGISDNNPFNDCGIEVDENCNLTILKELRISSRDWSLLITFLKKGNIPFYDKYIKDGEYSTCINIDLERLNVICNKLGGVPSFDLFYENFHKQGGAAEKKRKGYDVDNPTEPKEDEKKLYQWACCTYIQPCELGSFLLNHKAYYGWNFTKQVRASGQRGYWSAYYRREWKWTKYGERDIDEEEKDDETESYVRASLVLDGFHPF
jgi:hypothetical protein